MHFPITVVSLLLQTLLTVAFINFFGGLFCPELWSPSGMNGIEQVHGREVGKDRARNDWQWIEKDFLQKRRFQEIHLIGRLRVNLH